MQFGKGILPAKEYLSNGLFNIQNCYSEAESSFNQQLHFHDFYELSLIYEGSSRFLINGSSFVAAAGSLQLIRPSDYHRQMTDTGEYIRYYNLIFRQEVLSNVLLDALEEAFRVAGKTASAVTFFNPMHLPWVIPGSPGPEHNNMPGIATDLPLHERMLAHGYTETTQETAMYRTLTDYAIPPEVRALEHRTAAEGCTLALYDPNRHHGLDAMLQALDNPDWTVRVTAAARDGLCLPVALAGNTVAGFAGPVYPEPTGRGFFAGIGIAPQYQHRHLGKLLFFRLCAEEKRAGAVYMSLFTGVANPARRIYESAGFTSVRTFGVLLKTL